MPSLLAERGASSAGVGLGQCLEGLCAPSLRTERGASATLPSLPSLPLPRLAVRGCPPPGLAPLAPRLQAGSRGTAVRVTTLPFPMPTQAAPRVPLPCLRTRALGWSVLRWWGSPSYVVPWCPSLLAAPLGSPSLVVAVSGLDSLASAPPLSRALPLARCCGNVLLTRQPWRCGRVVL